MTRAAPDPVVSIVMANRDAGPFIAEAVRSVLGQSVRELELILVDDASSDDSAGRARAAGLGDARFRMVSLPRSLGPGGARNRALAQARGRFVAIVDSDDVIAPDRFESLLALAQAEDADLVADNLLQFSAAGDHGLLLEGPRWTRPRQVGLAEFVHSNRMYARQANLGYLKPVIRRAVLSRVASGYDEGLRVGEDYDLVARLLATGARYWIDPIARYRYRRHRGSTSRRLRRTDIEALLEADDRFRRLDGLTAADLAALDRRRRTLKRALAYDGLVAALKARSPLRALSEAAADPSIVPLLMLPVAARLARLRGAAAIVASMNISALPLIDRGSRSRGRVFDRAPAYGELNEQSGPDDKGSVDAVAGSVRDASRRPGLEPLRPAPDLGRCIHRALLALIVAAATGLRGPGRRACARRRPTWPPPRCWLSRTNRRSSRTTRTPPPCPATPAWSTPRSKSSRRGPWPSGW